MGQSTQCHCASRVHHWPATAGRPWCSAVDFASKLENLPRKSRDSAQDARNLSSERPDAFCQ